MSSDLKTEEDISQVVGDIVSAAFNLARVKPDIIGDDQEQICDTLTNHLIDEELLEDDQVAVLTGKREGVNWPGIHFPVGEYQLGIYASTDSPDGEPDTHALVSIQGRLDFPRVAWYLNSLGLYKEQLSTIKALRDTNATEVNDTMFQSPMSYNLFIRNTGDGKSLLLDNQHRDVDSAYIQSTLGEPIDEFMSPVRAKGVLSSTHEPKFGVGGLFKAGLTGDEWLRSQDHPKGTIYRPKYVPGQSLKPEAITLEVFAPLVIDGVTYRLSASIGRGKWKPLT